MNWREHQQRRKRGSSGKERDKKKDSDSAHKGNVVNYIKRRRDGYKESILKTMFVCADSFPLICDSTIYKWIMNLSDQPGTVVVRDTKVCISSMLKENWLSRVDLNRLTDYQVRRFFPGLYCTTDKLPNANQIDSLRIISPQGDGKVIAGCDQPFSDLVESALSRGEGYLGLAMQSVPKGLDGKFYHLTVTGVEEARSVMRWKPPPADYADVADWIYRQLGHEGE